MTINLHIERLVLEGLDVGPGQGVQVKAAVEAELSRLLTGGGLAPSLQVSGAMPSIKANPVRISEKANPSSLGQEIARGVYGGIGK